MANGLSLFPSTLTTQKYRCQLVERGKSVYCTHEGCRRVKAPTWASQALSEPCGPPPSAPLPAIPQPITRPNTATTIQPSRPPPTNEAVIAFKTDRFSSSPSSIADSDHPNPSIKYNFDRDSSGRRAGAIFPAMELDRSVSIPVSPNSSARASYFSAANPVSPITTSYSEEIGLEPTRELVEGVSSPSLRHSSSSPDLKWQEFPPPKELLVYDDITAPELVNIIKDALVQNGPAGKAHKSQPQTIPEHGLPAPPPMLSQTSRSDSMDGPILAHEVALEADQPGLQVVRGPISPPKAKTPAPSVSSSSSVRSVPDTQRPTHRLFMRALSSKSSGDHRHGSSEHSSSITTSFMHRRANSKSSKEGTPNGSASTLFAKYTDSSRTLGGTSIAPAPPKEKMSKGKEKNILANCGSCMAECRNRNLVILDCNHKYCKVCFPKLLLKTIDDEAMFPPACCGLPVSMKEIQANLDANERTLYKQKEKEFGTPLDSRLYCPSKSCRKWIEIPKRVKSAKTTKAPDAVCTACNTVVCVSCHQEAHPDYDACPQEFTGNSSPQRPQRNGWQQCPTCRVAVRSISGSHHLSCDCGTEFCGLCASEWKTCLCPEHNRYEEPPVEMEKRGSLQKDDAADSAAALRAVAKVTSAKAQEEERLEAERREQHAQEIAARRGQVEAKFRSLEMQLNRIHDRQRALMYQRHENEAKALREGQTIDRSEGSEAKAKQTSESHREKLEALERDHALAVAEMDARHQDEEDDTFVSITRAYRTKPDKDARVNSMMEKLAKMQAEERAELAQSQSAEREKLVQQEQDETAEAERALIARDRFRRDQVARQSRMQMQRVWADGEWMNAVIETRYRLLENEQQHQIADAVDDAVGQAPDDRPVLPAIDEKHLYSFVESPLHPLEEQQERKVLRSYGIDH